jgi:UDP-N-acetylglucosamine:LPS N-acetylglucosamine transferase
MQQNYSQQPSGRPHLQVVGKPMRKRRILFLIVDAGGGHRSAANAISRCLEREYPDLYDLELAEVSYTIGPFGRLLGATYAGLYNVALQTGNYWLEPWIFGALSQSRDILMPMGLPHFRKYMKERSPDMLVTLIHGSHEVTHAMMQKDGHIPNMTVVTDAATIRPSWVHPYCDQVIVSTDEARQACLNLGITPERIDVLGHPIDPRFARPSPPVAELRQRFGLREDRFTMMIMMGGTGGKNIYRFSRLLQEAELPVQIVACCGSDKRLLAQVEQLAQASDRVPIKALGFSDEIPDLMALSDLIITKPGPGTIMEAMAKDLPMIIDDTNYTMWQEKGNLDYVRKHNLGRIIVDPSELLPVVRTLMNDATALALMRENIRRHKKPDATYQIAQRIHERLQKEEQMDPGSLPRV